MTNYFATLHACAKHIEDDAKDIQLLIERNEKNEFVTDIERRMFERDLVVTMNKMNSEIETMVKKLSPHGWALEPKELDPE